MKEQIEKDKIYNCDCLEDEVSPDNTGETTDGKGKIRPELQKKIDYAIRLLKAYDNHEQPIEIAYSGGKDSDVILQLAKESGIHYRAIYRNTTIDPPGTISHVQKMGVEILRPKKTFFQLIEENGLPSRFSRFCCRYLKEYKVLDKCVMGVRKSESRKRAERYKEPSECKFYGSKKEHVEAVYPILEWTDEDVAEFIADRKIQCAPVYYDEQGQFHVERRLGCMGCPLASKNKRIEQFKKYPGILRQYCIRLRKYRATHPDSKAVAIYFDDEYEQLYRDIYCDKQEQLDWHRFGLFGKPDFKAFLEKQFGISLG